MKKIINSILLILLLISHLSYSQDIDLSFDYYGVENGLSQSEVYCTFQDSRGLIWFGTQAGLNRFDGRNFVAYDRDPLNPKSISSGWVHAIAESPDGNLWIGTRNGLNKFNPATQEFEHFLTSQEDIDFLGNNTVYGVLVENNDLIWIKTDFTISKFIPSKKKFIHYSHKSDDDIFTEAKSDFSLPMIKTKDGIWAGSSTGLQFLDFKHDRIQSFHHKEGDPFSIPGDYVTALAMDYSGNLYVGTDNGLAYFQTFYKSVRPSTSLELNNALKNDQESKQISGLIFDNKNSHKRLIITSLNGIVVYDLINKTHRLFTEDKTNPKSLKYNRIRSIFLDHSGNFWLGLNSKGINKFSPKGTKFKTYKNTGNSGVKLSDNVIASIYSDKENIWVGTWAGGVNIINKKTKKVTIINTKGEIGQKIVDDHVHVLHHRDNGNIWIGTKNGISIYSEKTNSYYSFEKYFGIKLPKALLKARINIITETDHDNLVIGTSRGLSFFNIPNKEFTYIKSLKGTDKTGVKTIYDILIKKDYLWIATFDGLYKVDQNKKIVRIFKADKHIVKNKENIYKTPSSSGIFDITDDKNGKYWLATESGLNSFDPKKETFQYFTEKNGLPNNTIYEILLAPKHKLWFSTNRGLAVIDAITDSVITYTISDGLQGLEYNNGASYASSTGEFLFGGSDGLNEFFPDSIKQNSTKPITTLIDYTIINNKGDALILKKSLFGKDHINMSYNDNSIRIDFASLEFTNPSQNQFKYKLEGLDNNWININEQNYVVFPSLPSGTYTLRVIGSNSDLIWGKETSIIINVSYPIYNNIWAYLLYILVVLSVIYKIWSDNKKKQRKSNEEIRNKQLLNLKLEQQKESLDIQNTSMTDSINYAKHIQEAMLPSEYIFKKLLPNSFILYKTKDIVSGDFYWIAQKRTKTFIAAVDCTGHGVPGAFMSIIGFDLLKNIVKERSVEDPAEILNQLNYGVSDTFRNTSDKEQKVRDGMDMTLCVIDHAKHTIEFSGAMNPLCLIRDNSISIIKGNRFSIGSFNDDETNRFDTHTFKYQTGDTIYLFSDGYADQFGGPLGKKFKQKRFLHMLLNISHLPPEKQKIELDENFKNWKGQTEQVDDVLVIGFKL